VLPLDARDRARFLAHAPLQVFSCWNGAALLDAAPFADAAHPLRFRVSHAADAPGPDSGEEADEERAARVHAQGKASECFLPSVDLWRRGLGRILLVPRASVAYDLAHYEEHSKATSAPLLPEEETVAWAAAPPERVAMQDHAVWYSPERWAPWDEQ